MKLALAQINCPKGDWPGNLRRTGEYMARARDLGCHVIVFPEASLSGYCDYRVFPDAAQPLDSPYITEFVRLTSEHNISASAGFLETNPGDARPFVTQIVAFAGKVVTVYRKIHIQEEEWPLFSSGTEVEVFDLPAGEETIRCGLAVCSDSDRPDLFALMAELGARVVLHSSAPGLYGRRTDDASWQAGYDWYRGYLADQLPGYARDNNLYIAVATQTGPTVDEDFPGGSFLFAPDGSCQAATPGYKEELLVVGPLLNDQSTLGSA